MLGEGRSQNGEPQDSRLEAEIQQQGRRTRHGLVERESELALVRARLEQARAGTGSIMVVESPPGHGKSALLEEACRTAAQQDLQVLSGTGREIERDLSFGVALQLFEFRLARAPDDERQRLMSGAAQLAAPIFSPEKTGFGSEDHGASLLHGLYWLCANLADERPLVISVDDSHLADLPTLRCILYLAQRVADLPVAVLLASSSTAGRLPLLQDIAAHPTAVRVRLRPLSPLGVARVVHEEISPDADESFCVACFEATGGVPLLVRELVSELMVAGFSGRAEEAPRVGQVGPESIAVSVLRRTHDLGEGGVQLARAVAFLGDEADIHDAARLAELDEADAVGLAERLMEADIFARTDRLSFVHPIVRRAVDAECSPIDRAEAHLRAAKMLAADGKSAEHLAGHLLNARRTGTREVVETLREAARSASKRAAPEAAVRYLRHALEEPPPEDLSAGLVAELGRAEAIAGEPRAVERLMTALELIEEPVERARTTLEMGYVLYAQGRHEEAVGAFRRGIDEIGDRDPQLAGRLWAAYTAVAALAAGEPIREPTPRTVAVAGEEHPAGRLLLAQRAFAAAKRGQARDDVRDMALRAMGRGELLRDESADGIHFYLASTALLLSEDLQAAEFALTAAVEDARSRGSVLGFATASFIRSWAILQRGRLNEAAADAESALSAQRYGWRVGRVGAHAVLARTLMERGDVHGAERHLTVAAEEMPEAPELSTYLFFDARARLRMLCGDAAESRTEFLDLGRRLAENDALGPAVVGWRSGAALAAAQTGDLGEARRLAEEEYDLAMAAGTTGTAGRALVTLGRVVGGSEGRAALARAVELLCSSQTALWRAAGFVEYGSALRRGGLLRASRDPLREGLDLCERLGATALADRAREELRAAGSRPRRAALHGVESLTTRERQVAELATLGMSNREIAEALFVTVKTIEWHLRHAYGKLDISSREELRESLRGGRRAAAGGSSTS